jgi:ATP-dependent helicase/nuclease subunit A
MVLEPPSFARAHATTRRRERAERQRLAYVAITRAADAMFLVGGRAREGTGDLGASTVAALEELAAEPIACAAAALAIEDVVVPPPLVRRHDGPAAVVPPLPPLTSANAPPKWRSLPIAPTALADFDHCSRRFELVHLLGLPEHVRGTRTPDPARAAGGGGEVSTKLDARAEGTLAHAVLERVPTSAFAGDDADAAASRALAAEGIPVEHERHAVIVGRVTRFLGGSYAAAIAQSGASLRREVAFVLPIEDADGRAVVLRGSMDLVVVWPDDTVDVVDYKSARSGAEGAYGFQLDVYALAARALFPRAPRLRAGLVYLGGASAASEPSWRNLPDEADVRARLAPMGDRLVRARWSGAFPRVARARCESIHCGFIGRCHASLRARDADESDPEQAEPASSTSKGTDAKPSRATTT